MSGDAIVHKRLAERLAVLGYGGDRAVWTCQKARKVTTCGACRETIVVGDFVWRPVGNQSYRFVRLHARCIS